MTSEIPRTWSAESEAVVDLRAHRLGDLVQALAGCRPEVAEMAVRAEPTDGRLQPDAALDALAEALVRVRRPNAAGHATA